MTTVVRSSEAPGVRIEAIGLLAEELLTHVLRDGHLLDEPVEICGLVHYQALPDLLRIDDALRYGMLRYPFVLMYRNGVPDPIGSYLENRYCNGERIPGFADYRRILARLKQGHSLEISGLQYWDRACAHISAALAARLRMAVDAQAFVTPPGRQGLDTHRDRCGVLAIQLSGRKRWQVFEKPANTDWRAGTAEDPGRLRFDIVLAPGDGIYFPPGCAHRVVAEPHSLSYHISLGIRHASLLDAVEQVGRDMAALPSASDTPHDEATTTELVGRLVAELGGLDIDRLIDEAYVATRQRSALHGERLLIHWVDGLAAAAMPAAPDGA